MARRILSPECLFDLVPWEDGARQGSYHTALQSLRDEPGHLAFGDHVSSAEQRVQQDTVEGDVTQEHCHPQRAAAQRVAGSNPVRGATFRRCSIHTLTYLELDDFYSEGVLSQGARSWEMSRNVAEYRRLKTSCYRAKHLTEASKLMIKTNFRNLLKTHFICCLICKSIC